MKTLYLVRHAKSSWADSSLSDFDRPLNDRGKRDAPFMGERLAKQNIRPDVLLSSPAKRAYSTAKKIAQSIDFPEPDILLDSKLYHADPDMLLRIVQKQPATAQSLMVFGHNPGLTEFASLLCRHEFGNVPTSGVVCIDFEVNDWKEVFFSVGTLRFFDYPKKYK